MRTKFLLFLFGCCFVIDKNLLGYWQKSDQCLSGLGANLVLGQPLVTLNFYETKAVLWLNQEILEVRTESMNNEIKLDLNMYDSLKTKKIPSALYLAEPIWPKTLCRVIYYIAHSTPCMVKRCVHKGVKTFVKTHLNLSKSNCEFGW